MEALAALYRLGLDWHDVALMHLEFIAAIERANDDLIRSFR